MAANQVKLQDNPRGALEQYINALQIDNKMIRKNALVNINKEVFENPANNDCDLTVVFPEIHAYILKSFSDPSEACRENAALIISNFIEKLPLNDYYLTYILPVLVRRIGCPEIVEESEELRLILVELVHKIIEKYKVPHLLSPFINDFTSILTKTSTDPFPKVKLEACKCIILLTQLLQRDFHFQSESYVKPVLSNFAHQHFRVRVASIKAIGAIVLAGNAKCFELAITPMAEKLFDENTQVRLQVTLEVGNWMLNYKDRYSFWHRMIPLLITSMSDVMTDVRETATKLWNDIGLQYMEENEEDLKKMADFLKDVPSHYPNVKRPNLGCRVLVQNNIGKIVPAIGREMDGWQADARLRSSQLLCWLLLCAEEGSTQHANTVVRILLHGANDDDTRIVQEIKRASEMVGYFITPDTWWPLLEADVDSHAALLVLESIIKSSRVELLVGKVMEELCKEIADPDRCRTRKEKYQINLMNVTESVIQKCGSACAPVFNQLFTVCFTVFAMPVTETIQFMALSNLNNMRYVEKCDKLTNLYKNHMGHILADIKSDPLTWSLLTPDRCLLDCVLLNCGQALDGHLLVLGSLLKECLAPPKVDPEAKLKVFNSLSTMLLQRELTSRMSINDELEAFLKTILKDVIMVNLVWSPGRTAEAIRSAAVACLCAALEPRQDKDACGDERNMKLFPTKESMTPFLDELVPLLTALVEDNLALTRRHSLRAIVGLVAIAAEQDCFTADLLHKIYFVVLKRLDDNDDNVRDIALEAICVFFTKRPSPYDVVVYGAHIDALYSALLVRLDDPNAAFRESVRDTLIALCDVDPNLLMKKVKSNIHLYKNKDAYNRLASHLEKMTI